MTEKQKFKEFLQKIEDPNYEEEVNYDLPENATPLEQAKYDICQSILAYQQDHNLPVEEMASRIKLTVPETKDIFFAKINNFTLDRLIIYASRLFSPQEIKVIVGAEAVKESTTITDYWLTKPGREKITKELICKLAAKLHGKRL
ncbi:46058_t:CDS:2 [Gigaspora margarita]|uniref:46058_t:CDS:1 n=1 Tax=Gigaspora margarita TaxID=4874 RepID=A0ABM8VWV8_GIGMA|nr:46058_t:CDS:2 [Gigaspora margarita]